MKKICRKISVLLFITQVITLIPSNAYANEMESAEEEVTISVEDALKEEVYIQNNSLDMIELKQEEHMLESKCYYEKYDSNEMIDVSFDNTDVVDYYYETEGIEIIDQNESEMQFDISVTESFGCLDVYADYGENEIVKSSVYTFCENDIVFVSNSSFDSAWFECKEYQFEQGMISKEEWEDEYSVFSRGFTEEEAFLYIHPKQNDILENAVSSFSVGTSSDSTTVVKGRLRWEIEDDGIRLPMRQTKVEVRFKLGSGSELLATTYTDDYGYYTFNLPDTLFLGVKLDVFIRYYSESYTLGVSPNIGYNYFDSAVAEDVEVGSTTQFNYCVLYNEDNTRTNSVYIQQCMIVGQRFATDMGMETDEFVHVIYPIPNSNYDDTAFCTDLHVCHVSGIGKDNFDNVDTLIHEYGHFVQNVEGIYGSNLLELWILNDPTHYIEEDHFSENDKSKEFAMELTWSESWATVFSQLAQLYYASEYIGVKNFADGSEFGIVFDNVPITEDSCEAQELAVIGFLWDLYDEFDSSETFDNISWSYEKWWKYTTIDGIYTLEDFANMIDSSYPSYRGLVGKILSYHQISSGNVVITNRTSVSESVSPNLSWKVNGSVENPNNSFKVVFFDANGTKIVETETFQKNMEYDATLYYTIPQSIWTQIVGLYDGNYNIRMAVYSFNNKENPTSGPYFSEYVTFTVRKSKTINLSNLSRYVEKVIKIAPYGYVDFKITVDADAYRVYQTFGTLDTIVQLYDSNYNCLWNEDDNGYKRNALGYSQFLKDNVYIIRVKCYSNYSGITKLSIIPATGALSFDASTLGDYTSLKSVSGKSGYTWTTYAELNYARIFTYTPPTSGTYELEITSGFDTYLYVIDPRSSNVIVKSVNYDDDSGEGLNSKITTSLVAGVPYLIVYSGYNLSNSNHTGTLVLKINSVG